MFKAEFISITGNLTYSNPAILHKTDFGKYSVIPHFEDFTCVFICENKLIQLHQQNINLIKIDSHQRTSNDYAELVVIGTEMKYPNSYILDKSQWENKGIPEYFKGHEGLTTQFAWSNQEGTFITLDYNVISIVKLEPKRELIKQIISTPKTKTVITKEIT